MTVKCHSFAECKLISFRVLRLQIKQIQDCMCPEFCYVPSEKNMRSRLDTGDEVKRPCQRVACAKSFFLLLQFSATSMESFLLPSTECKADALPWWHGFRMLWM